MLQRVLSVGSCAYNGKYRANKAEQTVKDLVNRVLRGIEYREFPVRLVLLYATADWCIDSSKSIAQMVRLELKEKVGYDVPLIGGSMAAIYCSTTPKPMITQGLALVALCSEYLYVAVDGLSGKDIDWNSDKMRQKRLRKFAQDLKTKSSYRQLYSAERYLFGFLPGIFLDSQGLRTYRDGELYQEIRAAFDNQFRLIGASSADGINPNKGYQFVNNDRYESGIALALIESEGHSRSVMLHSLTPQMRDRLCIDELVEGMENGYDVDRINGKPAAQIMQELAASSPAPSIGPFLGVAEGSDFRILFQLKQTENQGQTIRLNRRVTRADSLYVLAARNDQILHGSETNIRSIIQSVVNSPEDGHIALLMVFSCTMCYPNYHDFGTQWSVLINKLNVDYPDISVVVGLSSGVFGVDNTRQCRANNVSVIINCLSANLHPRSSTRKLQMDLLQAQAHLSVCKTEKEVMKSVLDGAIKAGAEGGQICIVDYTFKRIVGQQFGYAIRASGSNQDWESVLQITVRSIQKENICSLPEKLRDWALQVTPKSVSPKSFDSNNIKNILPKSKQEDILSLITRSLHAIFVPDATNPLFQCDKKAVQLGQVKTFLAIPLIGQSCRAIATLQVGFPNDMMINQESFVAWVRYGHAAASDLERVQNVERLEIEEKIGAIVQTIIQSSVNVMASPYSWCNDYLTKVKELLELDDIHMRVLRIRGNGKREYHLIGAVGQIAEIRRKKRPIINESDQLWDTDVLRKGGAFTNTKNETMRFHYKGQSKQYTPELEKDFYRELDELGSGAVLPVLVSDVLYGYLSLGTVKEYTFGDRGQYLAKVVARYAGLLLREREAIFDRALTDSGMAKMLSILTHSYEESPFEGLKKLLAHVCKLVHADVASLYIYHHQVKKLTLYIAHNWYKPDMEGKAFYKINEGWTGKFLCAEESVKVIQPDDPELIGTRKYYKDQVPPEHQTDQVKDGRIGLRLGAKDSSIGVVTFTYYGEHVDRLIADDERYRKFLGSVADIMTLAVENALYEYKQEIQNLLQEAKRNILSRLLALTWGSDQWITVFDSLREEFDVEGVYYYDLVSDQSIRLIWWSLPERKQILNDKFFKPFGELRNSLNSGRPIMIMTGEDPLLKTFPHHIEDTEALYAIPIASASRKVHSLLVLSNWTPKPAHPFKYPCDIEREAAKDIANIIGAERIQLQSRDELDKKLATAIKLGAAGLFSNIVLHQIGAPLGRIRRAVDYIRHFPDMKSEEYEKRLKVIDMNIDQTVEAIHKAAQQGLPGPPSRESISRIIRETLRVVQPNIVAPPVKIVLTLKYEVVVRVHLFKMVGALVNLIENALDAMEGSGTLTIRNEIIEKNKKNWVLLNIHNTGPSLNEDEIRLLSEPGLSTKSDAQHQGYGIPLARQTIEEAGGSLTISSHSSGGGVDITILLPLSESEVK